MTSEGVGFWSQNLYISPSSGTQHRVYGTTDEWQGVDLVHSGGGGMGCCWVTKIWPAGERSCFIQVNNGSVLEIGSLTQESGSIVFHEFGAPGVSNNGSLNLCPLSDTLVYMAATFMNGRVTVVRLTLNTGAGPSTIVDSLGAVGCISFHDISTGLVAVSNSMHNGEVWVTTDGGAGWSMVRQDPTAWYHQATWLDDHTVWLVGDSGRIARSTDAGLNWEDLQSPYSVKWLTVDGYSPDSVWVAGMAGRILATGDAGMSWSDFSLPDTMISSIQTFENAVYAKAFNPSWPPGGYDRLYRYGPEMNGVEEQEPLRHIGWVPSAVGIDIMLEEDESIIEAHVTDQLGRKVRAGFAGNMVSMTHLTDGQYFIFLNTSRRSAILKVIWVSAE